MTTTQFFAFSPHYDAYNPERGIGYDYTVIEAEDEKAAVARFIEVSGGIDPYAASGCECCADWHIADGTPDPRVNGEEDDMTPEAFADQERVHPDDRKTYVFVHYADGRVAAY